AKGFLESRTANDKRVRLSVKAQTSKIPVEGPVTRVCVRVAVFGDQPVSARILDQVGLHLTPVPVLGQPPVPSPSTGLLQTAPSAAVPPQTGPPPLSQPEAVRQP
ncbi:MAG: DUF3568 domain-containing protein, partial [Gemmataceae bacterium]|nr:DUF3568 domain-containing protein [Gemmataceae bacterium]